MTESPPYTINALDAFWNLLGVFTPGKTTHLKIGPPFRVAPVGVRFDKTTGKLKVKSFRITGQEGEVCRPFGRETKPTIEVCDRYGKAVYSGQFRFG